jgi:hypothetical protein
MKIQTFNVNVAFSSAVKEKCKDQLGLSGE